MWVEFYTNFSEWVTPILRKIRRFRAMAPSGRLAEFESLIRHTDEDALDQGELLDLAAVCICLAFRPTPKEEDDD